MSLYIKEKPEYLTQAIDSMLNQTVPPDEIVIVEDGPLTDELYEVIERYQKDFPNIFKIVINEKNIGLGLSLNRGLQKCKNELVARMDTDDISKPMRCEKQLQAFENDNSLSIVGSAVDEFLDDVSNVTGRRMVPKTCDEIYKFAKRRSAFNHPVVMYKKSDVLKFGGYSDLRRNQDVDLFGRMLHGGCKAMNFEESLLWFRSDNNLAKRRKSWINTKSYIETIAKFRKMGYSSFADCIIVAIAQTVMYLCPIGVQNWLYKTFLRG